MRKKKSKGFIREMILKSRVRDFYSLSPCQQQAVAVHVFNDDDDIDAVVSVAEHLPALLLKYHDGDMSAEEVLTHLMDLTRAELRSYLSEIYSDIIDEMMSEGDFPPYPIEQLEPEEVDSQWRKR